MGFKIRTYKVSSLHLDLANPRMRRATTESAAQEKLLDGYGDSIVALGRDIAQYGLSPLEQWAVIREGHRVVVLEGNRRLTACRLLLDPGKTTSQSIRRRFQGIRVQVPDERFASASCALFDSRAEARHWIELKHHGAGGGVGVAQWGPEMVYLHHRVEGARRVGWNELWILLEDFFASDADLIDALESARDAQYTLLERLCDAGLLEHLDLVWTGSELEGVIGARGRAFVLAVLLDMRRDGPLSSRSINSVEEARTYLASVAAALQDLDDADADSDPTDAASHDAGAGGEQGGGGAQADKESGEGQDGGQNGSGSGRHRVPRSTVFLLKGVRFGPFGGRIPRLAMQAQKLKFNGQDELCGVTVRVLLDLCTEVYWKQFMSGDLPKLPKRVREIVAHLDPAHETLKPHRKELRAAWTFAREDSSDVGKLIYALNDYVHNSQVSGQAPIAAAMSDAFAPLFVAMSQALRDAASSGGREGETETD